MARRLRRAEVFSNAPYSKLKISRCKLHRWSEKGVYTSHCREGEFEFQHYIKHLRKDSTLEASYLSPYGGVHFGSIRPDVFDRTKGKQEQ